MGKLEIFELLGVRPREILITDIRVKKWGAEVVIDCIYSALDDPKPFLLTFVGCRELNWEMIDDGADPIRIAQDLMEIFRSLMIFLEVPASPRGQPGNMLRQVAEGIRFVWRNLHFWCSAD